jgi:probable addiction module antidote protein
LVFTAKGLTGFQEEKVMGKKPPNYNENLIENLKDPKMRAAYLNAAVEDGESRVLPIAFRNFAEAYGGMGKLSSKTKLASESLCRTLSDKGNPTFSILQKIAHAFGLKMSFEPEKTKVLG